jgi:hypothetical protein
VAQVIFRIKGITRSRWERLHRLAHPSNTGVRIMAWLVVGGISVYGVGVVLPNIAAIVSGSPSAIISGGLFIGKHVVLVRDISGSMNEPMRQENLKHQIDRLKASGMAIDEARGALGFGTSRTTDSNNLLHQVEQALQTYPDADAIYAFSDFEITGAQYWQSDRDGYLRLETILTDHGVRLYLSTVVNPPPNELVAIARQSGGSLIQLNAEARGR